MDNYDRFGKSVTASYEAIRMKAISDSSIHMQRNIRVMDRFMEAMRRDVNQANTTNEFDDKYHCDDCGKKTVLKPKRGFQFDRIVSKCCGTRNYKVIEQ